MISLWLFSHCFLKYPQVLIIIRFRYPYSQVRTMLCICLQYWQWRRRIPAQENPYMRPTPQLHLSMQATLQEHVTSSSTWPEKNQLDLYPECMWLRRTLRSLFWDFRKQSQRFENLLLQLHHSFNINFSIGCIILWDARLDESCWTNLKPTESRWHHISVELE